MITTILAQAWPYLLGALALIAGWFTAMHQGKVEEQRDELSRINEQAAAAAKEQRNVENEVAALGDADVDSRLDDWVRSK